MTKSYFEHNEQRTRRRSVGTPSSATATYEVVELADYEVHEESPGYLVDATYKWGRVPRREDK